MTSVGKCISQRGNLRVTNIRDMSFSVGFLQIKMLVLHTCGLWPRLAPLGLIMPYTIFLLSEKHFPKYLP